VVYKGKPQIEMFSLVIVTTNGLMKINVDWDMRITMPIMQSNIPKDLFPR